MGILRVDKLSGLETPTAVTGSVNFDGNDHLEIGAAGDFNFLHNGATDWTAEFWVKTADTSRQFAFGTGASSAQTGFSLTIMSTDDNQADGTGVYAQFGRGSSGNYRYWGSNEGLTLNTWHHIAAVFKTSDKTLVLYVDGREVDSGTGTANGTFATTDYASGNSSFPFIVAKNEHSDEYLTGEISNLRVVSGRRLYTSNFTVPVHALETINGTKILCCNNTDSARAVSNADVGIAYTTGIGGDPTVATDNPVLTRDFTYGTEFNGATTFDTQGYFVPPSGTTEQRSRGRALVAGGNPNTNTIQYIQIQSAGNSQDFGDLTEARNSFGGFSDSTRGIFAAGYASPSNKDILDFVTISSEGNAVDFGNMTPSARRYACTLSSPTRGITAGGYTSDYVQTIEFVTIQSLGNAASFGDIINKRTDMTGVSSPTRGVFCGGQGPSPSPDAFVNHIEYITIASTGDATEFGDLKLGRRGMGSASDGVRGVVAGGGTASDADEDEIEYITIATLGNAQDFGNLTAARDRIAKGMTCTLTRGTFSGGNVPAGTNIIDFVTIQSTGNAQEFGDLINTIFDIGGCSDSHGGLS